MGVTFSYDFWNNLETPDFVLCNVNKQPVGTLTCSNRKMNYSNEISEISFTVHRMINGTVNPYYDSLTELQYIYLKNIGYFQITSNVVKITDKDTEYKEVTAQSTEIEFAQKYLTLFTINMGTAESIDGVSLYNNANPSLSLLDLVLEKMPSWKIGYVDPKFQGMQRSFQIDSQDIYSFLTTDAAEAFDCVFIFNTIDNTVNVYDNEKISQNTNIIISFQNLLKEVSVKPDIKSIKTALTLVGEDDLTVRELNMGYDTIYNFDYFHTIEYMGKELYEAYGKYKEKYTQCTAWYTPLITEYQDVLKQIAYKTSEMLPEDPENNNPKDWTKYSLNELNIQKKTYEGNLSVLMQQGYGKDKNSDEYKNLYYPLYKAIEDIKNEIVVRTNEITALQNRKEQLNRQMQTIIEDINIENNFTKKQWNTLSKFIREDVLNDSNYVVTDAMTKEESLEMQRAFLDFGNAQLAKYSQPQFSFQVSMANIFALPEFREHMDKFDLFNYITILVRDDYYMKAKLLSFDIDFEDNSLSVNFGSLNKTKNSNIFSLAANAMSTAASASTSVSFNKFNWDKAKSQSDHIAKNISDGLLKAGASLETTRSTMCMDDRGVFMKNTPESDNPKDQMAFTGSNILLSDDNWRTTRTALGRVKYNDMDGNEKNYYGIITELVAAGYITGCTIYGNDIKGSTITGSTITGSAINNGNGTFSVDENGNLTATNASIKGSIKAKSGNIGCDDNGNGGFIIDSNKMYNNKNSLTSNVNGVYIGTDGISLGANNVFKVDEKGNLTATRGNIAGWNLTATDLYDDNQVKSAGIGKYGSTFAFWAGTSFDNRNNAPFRVGHEGNLYAQNADIQGKITTDDITATKGTIGGATINNNSIYSNKDDGTLGWSINNDGSASFKNISITDNVTINGVQPGSQFGNIIYGTVGTAAENLYLNGGFHLDEASTKYFNELVVGNLTVDNLRAGVAKLGYATADALSALSATVDNLSAGSFMAMGKETGWTTIHYMAWSGSITYKATAVVLGYNE